MKQTLKQTLLIKHDIDTGTARRLRIVAGDCVDEINRSPSYSYNGRNEYTSARLVTAGMRKSQWYADAQFDENGNSDWL